MVEVAEWVNAARKNGLHILHHSENLYLNPFYALEMQLFDFRLFRFSLGETTE